MNHFVTIGTAGYLYKVYALAESLKQQGHDFVLHVLVVDDGAGRAFDNCRFYGLNDVAAEGTGAQILAKYRNHRDKLRWSLKPVLMKYLLQKHALDKIIYLDNDIFFYSDYAFLFDLLGEHSFLLTPHYYNNYFEKEQNWLEANFRLGLYNAGFVGAGKNAVNSLQWWAECCLYRCEKSAFRGLFDDQKYLDLIPVREPTAHIVRHQGCNVGGWNKDICRRELVNSVVMINGRYPVVFIHFNDATIREIISGSDSLLSGHYAAYINALKKNNPLFNEADIYFPFPLIQRIKLGIWKAITKADM